MRLSKSMRRAVAETQSMGKGSYRQLLTLNLPRGSEISSVKLPAFLHTQLSCTICSTIEPTNSGHGPVLQKPKLKKESMPTHLIRAIRSTY